MDRDPAGYQRVGALTHLPGVIRELGVDPVAILLRCGLPGDIFDNQDASISFSKLIMFFEQCVAETGCSHIGILLAKTATLDTFGVVGTLVRNAPTLGDALRDIVTNHHRYVEGGVLYLLPMGNDVLFGYAVYQEGAGNGAAQASDIVIAVAAKIIRELTKCIPVEVMLSRSAPENPVPFYRHYGAPVRFDAEATGLVFSKMALATAMQGADAAIYAAVQERVNAYWAAGSPNIISEIQRAIFPRILFGAPSVEAVAAALHRHPRTLNRQLHSHQTNFRGQVEHLRFELARQLLANTTIPVIQISTAFGYSAAGVFSRSFRRWSGASPTEWRGAHARVPIAVRAKDS